MKIDLNSIKPIYLQISEGIEEYILSGILKEEGRAYSQYQVAKDYNINPATAAKGLKLLEENKILFKKRGYVVDMSLNSLVRSMIISFCITNYELNRKHSFNKK